jgi:solute carrier family 25 protein 14/30
VNIICGATSGALANGIANPTDVLKVRMQAKSSNNLSMTKSFIDMAKHEGFKGLYRGVLPNMQRAAIITSIELPVYDSTKHYLVEVLGMEREKFSTHVLYVFLNILKI